MKAKSTTEKKKKTNQLLNDYMEWNKAHVFYAHNGNNFNNGNSCKMR